MDQIGIETEEYLHLKIAEEKLNLILDTIFENSRLSYDKEHLRLDNTDDLMTFLKLAARTRYYFKLKKLKEESKEETE